MSKELCHICQEKGKCEYLDHLSRLEQLVERGRVEPEKAVLEDRFWQKHLAKNRKCQFIDANLKQK